MFCLQIIRGQALIEEAELAASVLDPYELRALPSSSAPEGLAFIVAAAVRTGSRT
jgi:hypothetical protein